MAKILVIDDDPKISLVLSVILESEGYDVVTLNDPTGCLNLVENTHPDLVITDLQMPGFSGYRLIESLRACGFMMPIIVYAAVPTEDVATVWKRIQVLVGNALIQKGVPNHVILAAVQKLLDQVKEKITQ